MTSLPTSVRTVIKMCPHCGQVTMVREYDWPQFGTPWPVLCVRCGWLDTNVR